MLSTSNNQQLLDRYTPPATVNVSSKVRKLIDCVYRAYDNMRPGDKAVFTGSGKYTFVIDRVEDGCICFIVDITHYNLHHNEELHTMHTGIRYAGLSPKLVKSRYAVSNLLKSTLKEAVSYGIKLKSKPKYIRSN